MLYYAQGSALVTSEEMFERKVLGSVSGFFKELSEGKRPGSISFSTGELTAGNAISAFDSGTGAAPIAFTPIGPGKPLTVMIREIYTGRYPSSGLTGLFGDSKDLLVTSAIKSVTSFEGKPRAVNFLMKKISRGSHLTRSRASEQGTPFIFYSPALLEKSLTMDLSMVFDSFPKEVFEKIGDVLTAAAGIPLFLPQSTYLMAAGMLIKIAGGAGESIFDGKPVFESSSALDIYWPGSPPLPPGFALITSDDVDTVDPAFRNTYQVNAQGKVVDSAGTEYGGDIPYIVISMDGTLQEELASFSPTAASAAVLSRFFGIRQGQEQPLDTLIDAMKLYNDYHFRLKVDRLDRQIEASPPGEARDELKRKRDALAGNILEELLKPKS